MEENSIEKQKILTIYGLGDSPWTHAVCFAAHKFNYKIEKQTWPTFIGFFHYGLILPTLLDPILMSESKDILFYINPELFSKDIDSERVYEDARCIFISLVSVRLNCVQKIFNFFPMFSRWYESHDSFLFTCFNFAFRPLTCLYMLTLIILFLFSNIFTNKNFSFYTEMLERKLNFLEESLKKNEFLYESNKLTMADLVMFGIMQIAYLGMADDHSSTIEKYSQITNWIKKMNEEFKTYETLYSRRIENRNYKVKNAKLCYTIIFWISLFFMIYFWSITIIFLLIALFWRNFV